MSQIRLEGSSLVGRGYMPSSPLPQASDNGVIAFPESLEVEFRLMLEGTRNRDILNQATNCHWLENLGGPAKCNTPKELNKDRND